MMRSKFFKLLRVVNGNYFFQLRNAQQLYVLVFHQVNDNNQKFYPAVPTQSFEKICHFLARKFNILYFSEIEDYFKKPRKAAAIISFDDGHYDILKNAYPILEAYKLKFNINIITESLETLLPQDNILVYDVLNGTQEKEYVNEHIFPSPLKIKIDKNNLAKTEMDFVQLFQRINKQQRRLISRDIIKKLGSPTTIFSRVLSKEDVFFLHRKGVEIGSHSHSHPMLIHSDVAEIEFELTHSKNILENICGTNINILAYPDGRHNKLVIQKSLEAGYKYLLLTEEKKNIVQQPFSGNTFYRLGLYHESPDENLAKMFGFHQSLYHLRDIIKNVYHA